MEETQYKIPIAKPDLAEDEVKAVTEVIRSGWIIQGEKVEEFERKIADFIGSNEAIAVSSGTAALHIALIIAGCGKDDSVLCPSYSFIATANVIRYCGSEPIFIDIDPDTYNMNYKLLDKSLKPNTKAILAVHQVGFPAELDEIIEFANKKGLIVIEDAACAIGSEYKGVRIGRPHSLAACLSFHPRKIVTTGDGGLITTQSKEFAERARRLRQHGIKPGEEQYTELGYNYRLTDLQAALGIEQIKKLPMFLKRRKEQAERYTEAFKNCGWMRPQYEQINTSSNHQSYQLRIKSDAPISRDELLKKLKLKGITAQPGIKPIHLEPIYYKSTRKELPETERAAKEVIMLPIYHSLSKEEQDYIIKTVLDSF
jgi:perosamine synthetase